MAGASCFFPLQVLSLCYQRDEIGLFDERTKPEYRISDRIH